MNINYLRIVVIYSRRAIYSVSVRVWESPGEVVKPKEDNNQSEGTNKNMDYDFRKINRNKLYEKLKIIDIGRKKRNC